jgi:hypothetical protein
MIVFILLKTMDALSENYRFFIEVRKVKIIYS